MSLDISHTVIPRSDQMNADALIGGPITVTISGARIVSADQPVILDLEGYDGRPFKPSLGMRRVLIAAWGKDANAYIGRKLTLYRDPSVKWAGEAIGGVRISHMSHLDKPLVMPLTIAKGKKKPIKIDPLSERVVPARITREGWEAIAALAAEHGIENAGAWAQEQIGRALNGPQDITTDEAAKLHQTLTQEDEPEPQFAFDAATGEVQEPQS